MSRHLAEHLLDFSPYLLSLPTLPPLIETEESNLSFMPEFFALGYVKTSQCSESCVDHTESQSGISLKGCPIGCQDKVSSLP